MGVHRLPRNVKTCRDCGGKMATRDDALICSACGVPHSVLTESVVLRLTLEQRNRLNELGGVNTIRRMLNATAPADHKHAYPLIGEIVGTITLEPGQPPQGIPCERLLPFAGEFSYIAHVLEDDYLPGDPLVPQGDSHEPA